MKFKSIIDKQGHKHVAVGEDNQWKIISGDNNLLDCLSHKELELSTLVLSDYNEEEFRDLIPFRPAAYRDFMLYEKHAIDAARGFVKKYMPNLLPIVSTYERITGKPFPKLKPKKRYYKHPIYYMGNHLNFISDNDAIHIPSYTKQLDYELELAAVITKPLLNATIEEVDDAIGGYVILNDFSARDIQLDEMETGFGPMKTKNFGSAISSVVVTKSALGSQIDDLQVKVIINNKTIVESGTAGKLYSFQEAIAYASWEEQLHPGEIFGSGTIPGCTGIENGVMLNKGDIITLDVEGIGQLTNKVN